jgi:hypothetical protein
LGDTSGKSGIRVAAVLTLLLSLVVGIWALNDYVENGNSRVGHARDALSSSLSNYDMTQLNRDTDLERQDGFVAIFSASAFIAFL